MRRKFRSKEREARRGPRRIIPAFFPWHQSAMPFGCVWVFFFLFSQHNMFWYTRLMRSFSSFFDSWQQEPRHNKLSKLGCGDDFLLPVFIQKYHTHTSSSAFTTEDSASTLMRGEGQWNPKWSGSLFAFSLSQITYTKQHGGLLNDLRQRGVVLFLPPSAVRLTRDNQAQFKRKLSTSRRVPSKESGPFWKEEHNSVLMLNILYGQLGVTSKTEIASLIILDI